jgi:hypothetical protein
MSFVQTNPWEVTVFSRLSSISLKPQLAIAGKDEDYVYY